MKNETAIKNKNPRNKELKNKEYHYCYLETPVGMLEIAETGGELKHIYFVEEATHKATDKPSEHSTLGQAKKQLQEYIAGKRQSFDLPMAPEGTDFQKQVWQALTTIEYGVTCSYLDIAKKIGNHKAVRAVGAANGKNPLSIIVPCHRVIGSSGKLTGYAGGLSRKAWLLDLESGNT